MTLAVELVFPGTVIDPLPLQLAAEGSVSAAAPAGCEVAAMLQVSALVVAKAVFTVPPLLDASVVTPVFQDWKGGRYKIISFHAKRARGLMARYAVENRIGSPEALKEFASEGYAFDADASNDSTYVFRRRIGD